MPTALKTKSRDSNTQHVMLGREQMAYARDYAKSNGYTIRSIIECSIVYWLKAQGADVPDVQQEPRTVVQVTRDGGETWDSANVMSKTEGQGTVFVVADDGMTYQREHAECRSPYRWRWPQFLQVEETETEETDNVE